MFNLKMVDALRFARVMKAAGKGIDEGVRDASKGLRQELLEGASVNVGAHPLGGLTSQALWQSRNGALGFKFHTFDDGTFAIDMSIGAADLKHLAAVLDMAAAALAEMDTYSINDGWANEPATTSSTSSH